ALLLAAVYQSSSTPDDALFDSEGPDVSPACNATLYKAIEVCNANVGQEFDKSDTKKELTKAQQEKDHAEVTELQEKMMCCSIYYDMDCVEAVAKVILYCFKVLLNLLLNST